MAQLSPEEGLKVFTEGAGSEEERGVPDISSIRKKLIELHLQRKIKTSKPFGFSQKKR